MTATLSAASVSQNGSNGKGHCPKCGSELTVQWAWIGGQGERLCVRCTGTKAPGGWCSFGAQLEGNESLMAQAA